MAKLTNKTKDIKPDDLKKDVSDGLSLRKMAQKYDLPPMTMHYTIKRLGFQLKTSLESLNSLTDIETKADELTAGCDLPIDVEEIAQSLGFQVRYISGLDPSISGFLAKKSIHVNKDQKPTRNRFTLSHELGHALLHNAEEHELKPVRFRSDGIETAEQEREKQANHFGACLLMPAKEIEKKVADDALLDEDSIAKLAKLFNVSFSAMNIRLSVLGYCFS